jgi:hemerythrin-like domain-containing protein
VRNSRRSFLAASSVTGAGFLVGCHKNDEVEVGAVEDLMREHGVIRRALVVYREAGDRLRNNPATVPADALGRTARLLRSFGEDYHEKQLEEAHIFPALRQRGGSGARDIDTLVAQHQRGREITDYVLSAAQKTIGANAEPLAGTLEAFARMYEEHAAREDTIVFVAWKNALSPAKLEEMGDLFEDIEKKTFGKDGFEDAVQQASSIERAFGLDPGAFTAPPPKG